MRRLRTTTIACAVALAGCSQDNPPLEVAPTTTSIAPNTTKGTTTGAGPDAAAPSGEQRPDVAARRVGTFDAPVAFAVGPDNGILIGEKRGRVRTFSGDVVLDIRDDVSTGGEQGLLGIAVAPSGDFLYVNYTDRDGDSHVVEYPLTATRADESGRRELVFVDQPFANHNGGHVLFGPDGQLYIGFGDGGSQGDPHGNGQDRGVLLGKILRMDSRADGAEPSLFAYGVRNPWRFSFDRATGDMWVGDVGGSSREEVDRIPAGTVGANLGWSRMEGTQARSEAGPPDNHLGPVHEYRTGDGDTCAITGGYVYRGNAIPSLRGWYVFGDYCAGGVRALRPESPAESVSLDIDVPQLASFGEDGDGELYALSLEGDVLKLVPE